MSIPRSCLSSQSLLRVGPPRRSSDMAMLYRTGSRAVASLGVRSFSSSAAANQKVVAVLYKYARSLPRRRRD